MGHSDAVIFRIYTARLMALTNMIGRETRMALVRFLAACVIVVLVCGGAIGVAMAAP